MSGAPIHLHPQVRPFVDVLGEDRAVDFLLEFGGATFYLAADPKGNSEIARWLGRSEAAALIRVLRARTDHAYARIPVAKPWLANQLRHQRGMTVSAIARRLHVVDSTVSGWLKPEDRQLSLL